MGQFEQRGGQRGRVAGRDEQPGLAVGDDLGNAAGAARGDGQTERLRVEDRGSQAFGLRGQHEDVEHLQQAAHVLAEAQEKKAFPEAELAREIRDFLVQRAVADRDERNVRLLVQNESGGAQERRVVLVVGEGRHGADHQVAARDAERAAEVRRRANAREPPGVDAARDDDEFVRGNAVGDELRADRLRDADDPVEGSGRILEAAQKVLANREVDPAGRDEAQAPVEEPGPQAEGQGVAGMRVEDRQVSGAGDAGDAAAGGDVEFAVHRHGVHGPGARPAALLEYRSGRADDGGRPAASEHALEQPGGLLLAAAPGALGVDVQHPGILLAGHCSFSVTGGGVARRGGLHRRTGGSTMEVRSVRTPRNRDEST